MPKKQEFDKIPEMIAGDQPDNKEFDLLLKAIQDKYGITLKPEKNRRYLLNSARNFILERYEFRYNLFAKKPEWRRVNRNGEGVGEFEYFEDRDVDNVFNELEIEGNIQIGINRMLSLIGSNKLSRDYDPISEYIYGLPAWDGVDRFPDLLQQIKLKNETAEERAFLVKYFTKWFVTMVASLIDQNTINEVAVVFTGNEGRGKTRFFNNLVPKSMRLKYFYCGTFDPHDKDHKEYQGTKILIQLDEMETINRTSGAVLKNTFSTRYVVLRRAYGHGNIHLYRRNSFCGTINDDKFLLETGANRRWLPFSVEDINVDDSFNIDLLYAQALHIFRNMNTNGFLMYYDREEIDQFRQRNEQYRHVAPEEALIQLNYRKPTEEEINERHPYLKCMTAADVMHDLAGKDKYKKMNTNDSVARRIGKILSNMDFPGKNMRLPGYDSPRWAYYLIEQDSIRVQNILKGVEVEDESSRPVQEDLI